MRCSNATRANKTTYEYFVAVYEQILIVLVTAQRARISMRLRSLVSVVVDYRLSKCTHDALYSAIKSALVDMTMFAYGDVLMSVSLASPSLWMHRRFCDGHRDYDRSGRRVVHSLNLTKDARETAVETRNNAARSISDRFIVNTTTRSCFLGSVVRWGKSKATLTLPRGLRLFGDGACRCWPAAKLFCSRDHLSLDIFRLPICYIFNYCRLPASNLTLFEHTAGVESDQCDLVGEVAVSAFTAIRGIPSNFQPTESLAC